MKKPIVITLLVLALLFVLAGIGAVVFFTVRNVGAFVLDQTSVSVTTEESKTLNVEDGLVNLIVNDGAGDITVIGGDGDTVEIKVVKTGSAPTQARAEQDLEDIQYDIRQDGNTITLTYELDKIKTNHVDTVDFTITVPVMTSVNVETSLGEVSVSGINSDTTIANDFGDINVENITGALTANSNSGRLKVNSVKAGEPGYRYPLRIWAGNGRAGERQEHFHHFQRREYRTQLISAQRATCRQVPILET